jgi:chemotaxis protein CheZ
MLNHRVSLGEQVVDAILAAEPEDSPRRPILEEARRMIVGLLDSFERAVSTEQERLRRELDALASMIATMKREVDTIRADEIETRHMPTVNGEIGAIAAHLESATGDILDACENIENAVEGLDSEAAEQVRNQVTRIYEACNFHDISGQRIRKILNTLQTVEERIAALLTVLGQRPDRPKRLPPSRSSEPQPSLLEGPQLPGNGRSQDEIDALFS